jgi:hypothetical protein
MTMIVQDSNAAMRYKETVGLASQAQHNLRNWEYERLEQLKGEIAAAKEAIEVAKEREAKAHRAAQRWWRMAEDNVSRLSWLEVADDPSPAIQARGDRLDRYLDDVRVAYNELVQSVLQLGWRARR